MFELLQKEIKDYLYKVLYKVRQKFSFYIIKPHPQKSLRLVPWVFCVEDRTCQSLFFETVVGGL